MISVSICSCLENPERIKYLEKCVSSIRDNIPNVEILIGFDKKGIEIDGAVCYTHNRGMGHSWNWAMKKASYDYVLQIEDDWRIEIGGGNKEYIPTRDSFLEKLKNRIKVLDKYDGIFRFTCVDDQFWKCGKTKIELDKYNFLELNRPSSYVFNSWEMFYYSNQPHLKGKHLHDHVGYYIEDSPPHAVESHMCQKYWESEYKIFMEQFFTLVHIGVVSARDK